MLLAKKYALMTSSGSDFHDINKHELGVENDYSNDLLKKLTINKNKKL